ncbi:MAG: ATP synthase F1 subunit gamma [Lachnospiraceae bacterium]|nr:ATP synthase F1 subunit gamma [Lachnospiraceae bacterium]
MANTKELQNRIKSIRDTMKITKAMYMMSSMKLRKAKQKLENTEAYFYGLQEQIKEIMLHFPDMQHVYFDNRMEDMQEIVKKKAFIVITGDKGMAGAYNHNVMKEAQAAIDALQGADYRLFVVGEVGRRYLSGLGYHIEPNFLFSTNNPTLHRARVITELMVELYKQEEIDEVYVIYTRMINSMQSVVETEKLLPLKTHDFVAKELLEEARQKLGNVDMETAADETYEIYPSPEAVLEKLAYNYVTGFLYGALVEGNASEENARMIAMQSATDNAAEMLRLLSVEYNRVRQAAITQEITEVIGGAKALKKKKKKQVIAKLSF